MLFTTQWLEDRTPLLLFGLFPLCIMGTFHTHWSLLLQNYIQLTIHQFTSRRHTHTHTHTHQILPLTSRRQQKKVEQDRYSDNDLHVIKLCTFLPKRQKGHNDVQTYTRSTTPHPPGIGSTVTLLRLLLCGALVTLPPGGPSNAPDGPISSLVLHPLSVGPRGGVREGSGHGSWNVLFVSGARALGRRTQRFESLLCF